MSQDFLTGVQREGPGVGRERLGPVAGVGPAACRERCRAGPR